MKAPQHELDHLNENERIAIYALLLLSQNPTNTQRITMPKVKKDSNIGKRKRESSSSSSFKTRKGKRASAAAAEIISSKDKELPIWMLRKIQEMGGTNVAVVFQKELYATDVKLSNCRLSIPESKILNFFLSEAERKWLDETTPTIEERKKRKEEREKEKNENVKKKKKMNTPLNSLAVKMIDSKGNIMEERFNIKKWTMEETVVYNLVTGWSTLVKSNGLKEGMKVQLWSFRVESHLWFALVNVDLPESS
ncbi:B3 domain-containing protein At3g25182-like [Impatiens glandulifera]|uniref:B3 domain-containing protein At3g25182-like n=1 Tax=Impatiens glandulifera TaxID=253017 RepID=UPI001FB17617|nr:B3 domain-containing protein At3g25182-like [Impatiens glandulifera]